jgi:ubiquinone biosynthesis protein COQ9
MMKAKTMKPTTDPTLEAARTKILDAALTRVADEGWTSDVLDQAVVESNIDAPLAARAFPNGLASLIDAFHRRADASMEKRLAQTDLSAMKIRDRISLAVRLRLLAMEPHREAARRAMVVQGLPANVGPSLAGLYRTADAIWYAIGDTSTDFSFYTKRALVSGVYASTSVVWMSDQSDEFEDTWAFLDRRITDALKLGGLRRKLPSLEGLLGRWPGPRGIRRPLSRSPGR